MKNKRNFELETTNELKESGVKVSRGVIAQGHRRYYEKNESVIQEGAREQRVLKMKRFYTRRKWQWPPKRHHIATVVHMINGYYGKEVTKHTPKDSFEDRLGV